MRSGLGEGYHPDLISPPSPNIDLIFFSFYFFYLRDLFVRILLKIPCHAKWNNKKNGRLDRQTVTVSTLVSSHDTLILFMAFLNLPLLQRCLLVAFAVLLAKKGLELRLLLSNERFGRKKRIWRPKPTIW